jgi:hypothetical protein
MNPKSWATAKRDSGAADLCPPRSLAHCGGRGAARTYASPHWDANNVKKSEQRTERIARSDQVPGKHALSTALTWTNASCSGLGSCAPLTLEQPVAPWRLDEKYAAFFDHSSSTWRRSNRTAHGSRRRGGKDDRAI